MTVCENIEYQLIEVSHRAGQSLNIPYEDRELYLLLHPEDVQAYNETLKEEFLLTNPFIIGGIREVVQDFGFTKIIRPHIGTIFIIPSELISQGNPKILLDLKV